MLLRAVLVEEDGNGRRDPLKLTHSGFVPQSAVKVLLGHVRIAVNAVYIQMEEHEDVSPARGEVQSRTQGFAPQPNSESTTPQTSSRPSLPAPFPTKLPFDATDADYDLESLFDFKENGHLKGLHNSQIQTRALEWMHHPFLNPSHPARHWIKLHEYQTGGPIHIKGSRRFYKRRIGISTKHTMKIPHLS
jgi:hypothetical protein